MSNQQSAARPSVRLATLAIESVRFPSTLQLGPGQFPLVTPSDTPDPLRTCEIANERAAASNSSHVRSAEPSPSIRRKAAPISPIEALPGRGEGEGEGAALGCCYRACRTFRIASVQGHTSGHQEAERRHGVGAVSRGCGAATPRPRVWTSRFQSDGARLTRQSSAP